MTHPPHPLLTQRTHVGVILANLGTPDAPNMPAVARYLREFLSDRRVIQLPRLLWLPILYGFILPFRSFASAKKYASIWQDDSPLRSHSLALAQQVEQQLQAQAPEQLQFKVVAAMRYGKPSIEQACKELSAWGCRELILLPLFPQYSAVTTASVFDHIARAWQKQPYIPSMRFINSYHDHPAYIHSVAESIEQYWTKNGRQEHLLFSFHGLPHKQWLKGDPYHCFCQKTARLVAEKLKLDEDSYSVAFQSRLGPNQWLKPYTEERITALAKSYSSLDVIAPSFHCDCLETLEEIDEEYRELFLKSGGQSFHYIPALNHSHLSSQCLTQLISENLCTSTNQHARVKTVTQTA